MKKERLDKLLVDLKLAQSRDRAKALILAGRVIVDDQRVDKAGTLVFTEATVRLKGEDIPYVSRGGLKLKHALDSFDIDVAGRVAIDVGASTGGFTDCLLQEGVVRVFAVDVGYGQLDWRLRQDERVVNMERTNIRTLSLSELEGSPSLAVIDASFISLQKILPQTIELLTPQGEIIALIKPQFEVGKGEVGKGGIVRDSDQQQRVIEEVRTCAESLGCRCEGVVDSPIHGAKGNREFLIHLIKQVTEKCSDQDVIQNNNPDGES